MVSSVNSLEFELEVYFVFQFWLEMCERLLQTLQMDIMCF